MFRAVASSFRLGQAMTTRNLPTTMAAIRPYSHDKPVETHEQFDQRWIKFFQRADMDEWWLRKGMTELYHADAMPEPAIMIEALKAARKVNDYAAAVRFLEIMKFKCYKRVNEIWPWVMQEIQPTLNELGISSLEEMGYDKPEYFIPQEDNWWPKEYYDIYKIKPWNA